MIEAHLGAGGMGEVYRAKDKRPHRTVALKVLPRQSADTPGLRQRLEREAKVISTLNHPHICTLFDIGRQADVDYLVMEFLEGDTLARRLKKGALPLPELLEIAVQIANALAAAHAAGIVHRDLKPGNIMLTKSGAKLLDFGLAKVRSAEPGTGTAAPITTAGMLVGTVQYMSPEQIQGREADNRSDLFAFGATLYEMLTGERAFAGTSQFAIVNAILERDRGVALGDWPTGYIGIYPGVARLFALVSALVVPIMALVVLLHRQGDDDTWPRILSVVEIACSTSLGIAGAIELDAIGRRRKIQNRALSAISTPEVESVMGPTEPKTQPSDATSTQAKQDREVGPRHPPTESGTTLTECKSEDTRVPPRNWP